MKLFRKIIIKLFKIVSLVLSIGLIAVFIYIIPMLWKRIYTYPKLEKARSDLQAKYKKPIQYIQKTDYKGVLHAHSYWSHDSRGVIEEILPAAKKANLDFIFLSDHAHSQLDSFPRSYHGIYDNVIIEAGTEKSGLMVTPMKDTVLNWNQPKDSLIKQVVNDGGLVLYVHTEEKHDWANPDYQAMEIYNIHTDFKDEEDDLLPFVVNSVINGYTYKHWGMREIFDKQTVILARWDSINKFRKVVGMAAVDAHNNQNIRARYTDDGMVEWVGPNAKQLSLVEPGWKEKLLMGEPDAGGWGFKFELDTYFHSFNFVNTHVFSDTFSNKNIKENLVKGHAFIAFESLADAKGFQYYATDIENNVNAIMGDSISTGSIKQIQVISPLPVHFKLIRNGEVIDTKDNVYEYKYDIKNKAGNYRMEAFLNYNNKLIPWIYTNPIYIHNNL
ncbi:MAG: hypothetical protein L3J34_05850 [Flavobacteriaceae bacterium]|nr:hypothetical protein [Flavobacteriaceae bacterium]